MNLSLFLRLGRTSNLPTVWTNVVAATVLAGGALELWSVGLVCVLTSALYVAGMFLNDAFDAEHDAQEQPQRPIPAGEVERNTVYRWGATLLSVAVLGAFALGVYVGLAALFTCAAIVLYNARHKHSAASPFVMGLCRLGVYAIAGFASTPSPHPTLWVAGLLLLGYVLGLTYAAKFEVKGGIGRWTPLLGLAAPVVFVVATWSSAPLLRSFVGGYALWIQKAISAIRSGKADLIRSAIGSLIAGICLFDAMIVANSGETSLAMACVGCFGLTLTMHSRIRGT